MKKRKNQKFRLDDLLVRQGYFATAREAEVAIRLARVRIPGSLQILEKPGQPFPEDAVFLVDLETKSVGRGSAKLEGFLNELNVSMAGVTAVDVGSSTGGFTECLLERGLQKVYAVDVGTHQLHEKLRNDSRVEVHEQTDIRSFALKSLVPKPKLVVIDVSFISLRMILPYILQNLDLQLVIALFKPQFEVDRHVPKKRGVAPAKESDLALKEMLLFFDRLGLNPIMVKESSLKGSQGNQETFIAAVPKLTPTIFRTYDIRGNADRDLSDYVVERIAFGFAEIVREKRGPQATIGIGRDARESSPRIFEAVKRGIHRVGMKAVDLGEIPTPLSYFAHYQLDLDAIFQITASHNPREDNGFKMMIGRETLFGDEIQRIREKGDHSGWVDEQNAESLPSQHADLISRYFSFLQKSFNFKNKWKIALDCGNGMAGAVARKIFTPYASEISILFEEVDCRFPNHEADPTVPKNLKPLQDFILANGFDIGFAFDGDADRLGVVTKSGRILWGDEILMLLSELVLQQKPGATIIGEVKCSEKLFRMVKSKGGNPLMYKTGHSLIKKKMKEVSAPLAGEMSGHLFFADRYFGYDDAIYGALRVLEVMDSGFMDLDAWISSYPASIVTPELRVVCEEAEKIPLVEKVKEYFKDFPNAHLNMIDGIRVGFQDGSWALVRSSNTQAVLVVRIEAISEGRLAEIQKLIEEALDKKLPRRETIG